MGFRHTEETKTAVREHVKEGFSATKSGKILGLSKGAVIGLRTRLGLTDSERWLKRRAQEAQLRRKPTTTSVVPYERKVDPIPKGGLTLLGLKGSHCRWPVSGDGEHTLFCGDKRDDISPYCRKHHERARGGKELDETSRRHRTDKGLVPNFAFPGGATRGGKAAKPGAAKEAGPGKEEDANGSEEPKTGRQTSTTILGE